MSKSDTVLKKQLDSIGDVEKLKRRRFIGGSTQDQELWQDGGLTFGINKTPYGSCDFAWYTDEKWDDPYNGKSVDKKPQLVVEATDALNTRSFGDAQIQRIHHALGPFLCNVDSVYWLRGTSNSERLQEYVAGTALFLTQYHQARGLTSSYLITTDLVDIKNLVIALGKFGANSREYSEVKRKIWQKMYNIFYDYLKNKGKSWKDYLAGEEIIKSSKNQWIKLMGARKQNWLDSSKRGGHTYVGKAIASKFLLIGSKLFNAESSTMYILWSLMTSADIKEISEKKSRDKEWRIISVAESKNMKIKTFDDLHGVSNELQQLRVGLLEPANLNKSPNKANKNKFFKSLISGLKDGSITLT